MAFTRALYCLCFYSTIIQELFCYLSCAPKKGNRKKGARRKFFTACSVVLGTFRKLALRGSNNPKCLTLGLGRTPKFSYGYKAQVLAPRFPERMGGIPGFSKRKFAGVAVDSRAVASAERLEPVPEILKPLVRLVVPHLGVREVFAHQVELSPELQKLP